MSKSKYPNSIDTSKELPVLRDDIVVHGSKIINSLRSAIIQIEKTLGTNPNGFEGNTLAARLNSSIDELGNIKSEALEYLNILSGPISNSDVKDDAGISEEKLKLEYSTNFLYNQAQSVKRLIEELSLFLDDLNSKLSSHLSSDAENRHTGKNIEIEPIAQTISNVGIKSSPSLNLKELMEKIFSEHFNYTGEGISLTNNSHSANQIYFDNSNFNVLDSTDVQSAIDEISTTSNSDLESHQIEMHSNSKTKLYKKEVEIQEATSFTFSSYSYSLESNKTLISASVPFENDSVKPSNYAKFNFDNEDLYYNITKVTRDSSGKVESLTLAGKIDPSIQTKDVSIVSLSEEADFFSLSLARYEYHSKTNSSTALIIPPTSPTIYSDFLNIESLDSSSNTLYLEVSGKSYTVNCLPTGTVTINSVVEKINEELSGLSAPVIAYTSNKYRNRICISHMLESNETRYIKLLTGNNNANSKLGISDYEDLEVYDSKFSNFILFGKKHSSLNTKFLDTNLTIEASNKVTSFTGVKFSEYGVRKGDILIIEGSTYDDGAYRIEGLSDFSLTLDLPSGIFTGQATGSGVNFYIKESSVSFEDLILTSENFSSSDESGLHSVYLTENKNIISKNIVAYESQSDTFHIVDCNSVKAEEISISFSINLEDKIVIELDGNKKYISEFDNQKFEIYSKSKNKFLIYISSYSNLYNRINSNLNKTISSSIKIFEKLDEKSNLFVGNLVFDNFSGTLRGSDAFSFENKLFYGSIEEKDISYSFIKKYFEEYRSLGLGNSIKQGCEIYSAQDDGSGNYKFVVSSGIAIVGGKEVEVYEKEYLTEIQISSSNSRVYIGIDSLGNINYEISTPSSGCDCPFDLGSHAILGVINYKEISSVDYIETTDLRSFVGQYSGLKDGVIYIDSDKTKSNFRSINSAFKYAKVLSHLSDSIGTPRIIFSPGLHTLCVENSLVQESQINDESKYKLIAESIYDNGMYIDFPVIIEGFGESTVLSFSSKWSDSTFFDNSTEVNEGIIFIAGEDISSGSYYPSRALQQGLSGKIKFKNFVLSKTKIFCVDNTSSSFQAASESNSSLDFENVRFTRDTATSNTFCLKLFSRETAINSYFHNRIIFKDCSFYNSSIHLESNTATFSYFEYSQFSNFKIEGCNITTSSTIFSFLKFERPISTGIMPINGLILNDNLIGNKMRLSETITIGVYNSFYESFGFDKNTYLISGDSTIELTPVDVNMSSTNNISLNPDDDFIVNAGERVTINSTNNTLIDSDGTTTISSASTMSLSSEGNMSAFSSADKSSFGLLGESQTIIHSETLGMQFAEDGSNSTINTTNLTVDSAATFNGDVDFTGKYRKSYVKTMQVQVNIGAQSSIAFESSSQSSSAGFSSKTLAFANMLGTFARGNYFGQLIIPFSNGRIKSARVTNQQATASASVALYLMKYSGAGDMDVDTNWSFVSTILGVGAPFLIANSLIPGQSSLSTPSSADLIKSEKYAIYIFAGTTGGAFLDLDLLIEEYE